MIVGCTRSQRAHGTWAVGGAASLADSICSPACPAGPTISSWAVVLYTAMLGTAGFQALCLKNQVCLLRSVSGQGRAQPALNTKRSPPQQAKPPALRAILSTDTPLVALALCADLPFPDPPLLCEAHRTTVLSQAQCAQHSSCSFLATRAADRQLQQKKPSTPQPLHSKPSRCSRMHWHFHINVLYGKQQLCRETATS
jgi:hypothetical protein